MGTGAPSWWGLWGTGLQHPTELPAQGVGKLGFIHHILTPRQWGAVSRSMGCPAPQVCPTLVPGAGSAGSQQPAVWVSDEEAGEGTDSVCCIV